MCGRFAFSTPIETLAASIDLQLSQEVMDFNPNWNIAPSSSAPILVQSKADASTAQGRTLRTMRWGFRPSWAKPSTREPINARSETVLHKPMFRSAFMERRAVVPANGWYEWMTTPKEKFRGIIKEAMGSWRFSLPFGNAGRMKAGHCIRLRCLPRRRTKIAARSTTACPCSSQQTTWKDGSMKVCSPRPHQRERSCATLSRGTSIDPE